MAKYRWKFLHDKDGKIVSDHGDLQWKPGEWQHVDGSIRCCGNGLHCSKTPLQALGYVSGSVLAKVEVKGSVDLEDDKEAYSDMRIVKAYKWTVMDSVKLAIFGAEQVIDIFEKYAPDDKRPREAIEAAKKYLEEPTKENSDAADAAAYATRAATYAAYAARAAAGAAAYAARAAAYAATYAADAAAYATRAAAYAAYAAAAAAAHAAAYAATYAADAAAYKKMTNRINKWVIDHVKELEEM